MPKINYFTKNIHKLILKLFMNILFLFFLITINKINLFLFYKTI